MRLGLEAKASRHKGKKIGGICGGTGMMVLGVLAAPVTLGGSLTLSAAGAGVVAGVVEHHGEREVCVFIFKIQVCSVLASACMQGVYADTPVMLSH